MSMGNLLISTHQPHGSAPQGTTTLMQSASVINQTTMNQSMNALKFTGMTVTYAATQLCASSMLAKRHWARYRQTITGALEDN